MQLFTTHSIIKNYELLPYLKAHNDRSSEVNSEDHVIDSNKMILISMMCDNDSYVMIMMTTMMTMVTVGGYPS